MTELFSMIKTLPKRWQTYVTIVIIALALSGYTKTKNDHEARIQRLEQILVRAELTDSVEKVIMDVRLRKMEVWACFSNRRAAQLAGMTCPEK